MDNAVEWGFSLIDYHQPRPGLQRHSGHVGGRRHHKAGTHNHKEVATLRVAVRIGEVFLRQGLSEIDYAGNQLASTSTRIGASGLIYRHIAASTPELGDVPMELCQQIGGIPDFK
jgi:hypothetical protein